MVRAAIITQQRTGSGFLIRCLNSHPQIWCPRVELFYRRTWRDFLLNMWQSACRLDEYFTTGLVGIETLQNLRVDQTAFDSNDFQSSAPARVTKIMHNQMLMTPRLHRYIVKNTDIRIVHLRRDNLLKQYVSNMLNKADKGHYRPAHTTEPLSLATIEIDPRHAMYRMHLAKLLYAWYEKRLSRHPSIELVYEHMIDGNRLSDESMFAVCELLGLPPEPLWSNLVKSNPDDLRMIITNYDEVARALAGTEFEQYLD